ncbi:MAG: heavy metal-binding domain-containing protein [Myxococcota bacterium]
MAVHVSGMSGNEIWCLQQQRYSPGELVVGNSVVSLGLVGGLVAGVRGVTGGELGNVTQLISEGRHLAIERMVKEARDTQARGVTSVVSELRSFSGYIEFLSQGTALMGEGAAPEVPFTTAASGMELYCHLDAGYHPLKFAMGNVAYALGVGRSFTGRLRTMARGEIHEFSSMYNNIRHLALERLQKEAYEAGANAVVDVTLRLQPFHGIAVELLLTGTAASHPGLPKPAHAKEVVTSELTGEELWNLAAIGMVPVQLVMATSVYSLGLVGGWGSALKGMSRGEIPELTSLVYDARHNCVELLRKEAEALGAEQVIGNKLSIREIGDGLIEVMAVGTAVRRAEGVAPATALLPPQAIIVERSSLERTFAPVAVAAAAGKPTVSVQSNPLGCLVAALMFGVMTCFGLFTALLGASH